MTITGDRFLSGVKRRMTIPANQILVGDSGICELGDDVTRDKLVPLLLSVNQNFFVYRDTAALVASTSDYQIPYRSIGRGLRDLKIQQVGEVSTRANLVLVALEDEHMWAIDGTPTGFYFQGDQVVVVPTPASATHELVRWYDLQPNRIVKLDAAAKVSSVLLNVVTCVSVPSTILAGTSVDLIQGKAGCGTRAMDLLVTNVTATTITFATAAEIPTSLVAGDYISLSQESPVIQLPDEAFPLLETMVAARLCYAIGDFEGQDRLTAQAQDQDKELKNVLQPRIQGEPTKIVNRSGLLRRRMGSMRTRGGFYG